MDRYTSATLTSANVMMTRRTSSSGDLLSQLSRNMQKKTSAVLVEDGVALTVPYIVKVDNPSAVAEEEEGARAILGRIIADTFSYVEGLFSPFAAHSVLKKFNDRTTSEEGAAAILSNAEHGVQGLDQWPQRVSVEIPEPVYRVLKSSESFVQCSEGLFDPTAVKFGEWYVAECERQGVPHLEGTSSEKGLESRAQWVGWGKNLRLDVLPPLTDSGTLGLDRYFLTKRSGSVTIDLCGLSKGWCVDELHDRLQQAGFKDIYVDWGGDLRASGRNPKGFGVGNSASQSSGPGTPASTRGWRCHVLPPMDVSTLSIILEESASWLSQNTENEQASDEEINLGLLDVDLRDCAICTSGDYFSKNAATGYTHITNPKTKRPLLSHDLSNDASEGRDQLLHQPLSATVLCQSCSAADACATILMLLPAEEIADWVKHYNEVAPLAEQIRRYILVYPLESPYGERFDVVTNEGKWRRVIPGAPDSAVLLLLASVPPGRHLSFQVLDSGEGQGALQAVHWTELVWDRLEELPSTPASGETDKGVKPTGLQRLKRVLANYPRLVTVVLVQLPLDLLPVGFIPTQFRKRLSELGRATDDTLTRTQGLWFAMTLTSGVLLSDKASTNATPTALVEAAFFLMRNGYLAQILQYCSSQTSVSTEKNGVSLLCHYSVLNNSEESTKLAEQFSRGAFLEGGGRAGAGGSLEDTMKLLTTASHVFHRSASLSSRIEVVGDHLLVTVSTSTTASSTPSTTTTANVTTVAKGSVTPPPPLPLLRQGREYHSRAKVRYLSVPCVGTCSRFPYAAGTTSSAPTQRAGKPVFLGTILQAVDFTSRSPPLLTAFAKRNKLNNLLFGENGAEATSSNDSRLHVRLHFVDATSTGAGFLDWFADGSCTETDMQFMYFPPPRRLPANVVPSPSSTPTSTTGVPAARGGQEQPAFRTLYFGDGTSTCVVDYIFASNYPTRYLDCVYVGQFPVNNVYFGVVLKPLDSMTTEEATGSRRFDGDGESSTGASFPI